MKRKFVVLLVIVLAVAALTVVLTACNNQITLGSVDNIRYNGTAITWDAVENVSSYEIQINDEPKETVTNATYTFNASSLDSFTVSITAHSSQPKVIKSSAPALKTYTKLQTISDITVEADGSISWSAIDGALEYEILLNGSSIKTENLYYDIEESGTIRLQIRPVGAENTYSYRSEQKTFNRLTKPGNIEYDGSEITWSGATGASSYEININGNTFTSNTTSLGYDAQSQNIEVKVRAIGDGNAFFSSAFSDSETYIQLGTVTNVNVENGVLTWDEVTGATGYKIRINNTVQSSILSTNSYGNLSSGVSYRVSVLPYSSTVKHFASWCQELDIYLLDAPVVTWNTGVDLSDGVARTVATWDGINQANGYTVKVTCPNGQQDLIFDYEADQRGFQYAFVEVGDYTISARANAGLASGIYNSKFSTAINVTRLPAPTAVANNHVTSSDTDVALGFTVTFNRVTNASGYEIFKDDVKLGAESATFTTTQVRVTNVIHNTVVDAQEFNYTIKSVGSVNTMRGVTTVRLGSIESLAVPISILAMPTNVSMSGFTMSWDSISQSNGYVVGYSGTSIYRTFTNFDLATLNSGTYALRVSSRGNGQNVLSSNYTPGINAVKLAAPLDVRISTQEGGEGILEYNPVPNATSYDVTIDNSTTPIPSSSYGNMYQYITTLGSVIHMVAVANYWDGEPGTGQGIYYISSNPTSTARITRLLAPTNLIFTNTEFRWNSPGNLLSSVFSPNYQVYNATGTMYNGEKNGTAMDISYLDGGVQYSFKVKAVGDGYNYINSQESEIVTIYKIATPTVAIENNSYVWDSVVSAVGYDVYVEGVIAQNPPHISGSTYSFTPTFTQVGKHTVWIVARGDNGSTTINSKPFIIEQETKQLATPTFEFGYTQESFVNDGAIFVQVTSSDVNVLRYDYEIAGVTLNSETKYQSHNPNGPGTYTLRVTAMGGIIDEEGVYWVTSQTAGGSGQFQITLIATPNWSSIGVSQDGRVAWGICTGSIRYEYQVQINGGAWSEIASTTNLYYDVPNWNSVASITIRVRAIGTGTNSITSQWQEKTLYK